jgi:hypothetical protein
MTQLAVSSKVNHAGGRERQTDGLWTHLGQLNLGGSPLRPVWGTSQTLTVWGQGVFQSNPPPVNNALYAQGQLQMVSQTPAPVSIGFHESGNTGLALYKQVNANALRVRTHDGIDYQLAGAPGSAQALIGQLTGPSGAQIPGTNAWYESPQQVTAFCLSGTTIRAEATGQPNFSGGQTVYMAVAVDGGVGTSMWVHQFNQNTVVNYTIIWYFTGLSGNTTHRFAVAWYSTAGTGGFWPSASQALWVTEQRC